MTDHLKTQFRVLYALIRREMTTRYGRSAGGYLWAVVEPMAFIAVLSVVFSEMSSVPPLGLDFPLFFATGYLGFSVYRTMAEVTSTAVKVNLTLLTYPKVTPLDTVLARAALQFVTNIVVCVLILGFILLRSRDSLHLDLLAVSGAFIGASVFGAGVGLVNITLFAHFPTWERIYNVINRPLFLISGVFFVPELLPTNLRELALYNPLLHFVSWFRSGFYPTYDASYVNYAFIGWSSIILLWLGVLFLERNRYRFLEL